MYFSFLLLVSFHKSAILLHSSPSHYHFDSWNCLKTTRFLRIYVQNECHWDLLQLRRGQLKCDGTRAENIFRLSAKRTIPIKSAGRASVQSTAGSRGVRISGSNAGYTMFRGSVKSTGYPLHSPVSPSLAFLCVTVCHHISTGLYHVCLLEQATG